METAKFDFNVSTNTYTLRNNKTIEIPFTIQVYVIVACVNCHTCTCAVGFALFVCLFDLACYFLSSFSSLINNMYMYMYMYMFNVRVCSNCVPCLLMFPVGGTCTLP